MTVDSTIDFEKRRNIPVRYDRELIQTTIKAMKRVGEIKKRREHAFWKNRMTIAKDKQRADRTKKLEAAKSSMMLIEPESRENGRVRIREKIKVAKARSALVQGEDRSMGMDLD